MGLRGFLNDVCQTLPEFLKARDLRFRLLSGRFAGGHMGLDPSLLPYPADGGRAQAGDFSHFTAGPASRFRKLSLGEVRCAGLLALADRGRSSRTGSIISNAFYTQFYKSFSPASCFLPGYPQSLADLQIFQSICGHENDTGTLDELGCFPAGASKPAEKNSVTF